MTSLYTKLKVFWMPPKYSKSGSHTRKESIPFVNHCSRDQFQVVTLLLKAESASREMDPPLLLS